MTMNDSWGYHKADDDWKSPKTIVRNLISCARDGGNYLLNIGPKPDGSIPEESVRILTAVGDWMDKNGSTIYEAERCKVRESAFADFTRKGNTLYIHVYLLAGSNGVSRRPANQGEVGKDSWRRASPWTSSKRSSGCSSPDCRLPRRTTRLR